MKNDAVFWIVSFVLYMFIDHVLLNRKFWPVLGYGIGAAGSIGVSHFFFPAKRRRWIMDDFEAFFAKVFTYGVYAMRIIKPGSG